MITSAFKALSDMLSPSFRAVLLKSAGLSLLLFILVFLGLQGLFWFLTLVPWPWLETLLAVGASFGLLVAFFFLMAPVTALFAGLFLDDIAAKVEHSHYSSEPLGKPQTGFKAIWFGVQFGVLVLAINILALPLVFTGFGAIILVVINAYLISREYFELAAMRHMPPSDAKQLRLNNGARIFVAGFLPATMALIPLVNLTVPLFATAYFVHLFKRVARTSG